MKIDEAGDVIKFGILFQSEGGNHGPLSETDMTTVVQAPILSSQSMEHTKARVAKGRCDS